MPILHGPLTYLTGSDRDALLGLPALATFAEALNRPIQVLIRVPQRMDDNLVAKLVESVAGDLSPEANVPISGVRPRELVTRLRALSADGGLLALQPSHRRGLGRILSTNQFERLLHHGPLPLLTLPQRWEAAPIRRVLFPADFANRSDALLDETITLCKQLAAELHLLHVYGPDGLLESDFDIETRSAASTPFELLKLDEEHLTALRSRASAAGVNATSTTAEGRAHQAILRYIKDKQIDLVVMASHGPRSSQDIFSGTTTVQVILKAGVPVLAAHI